MEGDERRQRLNMPVWQAGMAAAAQQGSAQTMVPTALQLSGARTSCWGMRRCPQRRRCCAQSWSKKTPGASCLRAGQRGEWRPLVEGQLRRALSP